MTTQPPSDASRRRNNHVSIALPVEASGIDLAGEIFCDKTKTTAVNCNGCRLSLPRLLATNEKISLHWLGTGERTTGRVVEQMGVDGAGYLYGVSLDDTSEDVSNTRLSSSLQKEILHSTEDGIYFVSRDRKITHWNDGAEKLAGYNASEAVGQFCFNNLLGHVDKDGKPLCTDACPLSSAMADGQPRQADVYLQHKDGQRVPIRVYALPMRGSSGEVVGAVEIFTDPRARDNAEKRATELEDMAFRDSLTGLMNRRYMELKVAQALEDNQQFGRQYGLLMLDLDRFKQVNDTHGHDIGDVLLKAIAKTLQHTVRNVDIVSRWGGEEFLVLMTDLNAIVLGDMAERCRVLIARSAVAHGASRVAVTASIGATLLNHADSAETIIRRADELMYQSKESGGNRTTAG